MKKAYQKVLHGTRSGGVLLLFVYILLDAVAIRPLAKLKFCRNF